MATHRLLSALLVASLFFAAAGAGADEPDSGVREARRLVASARAHFNLGEYEPALADYRDAYRLKPVTELLFNIGQCERRLGRHGDAARSFRAFLREGASPAISADEVRRLIADAERAAAATANPVDRDAGAPTPPPSVGEPAVASVTEARPRAPSSDPPVPAPPVTEEEGSAANGDRDTGATPSAARAWYRRPTPVSLTIAGTVTLAVGGALLGAAASAGNQAGGATRLADLTRLHEQDLRLQSAGWPLLAIGAGGATAGVVIFALQARRAAQR